SICQRAVIRREKSGSSEMIRTVGVSTCQLSSSYLRTSAARDNPCPLISFLAVAAPNPDPSRANWRLQIHERPPVVRRVCWTSPWAQPRVLLLPQPRRPTPSLRAMKVCWPGQLPWPEVLTPISAVPPQVSRALRVSRHPVSSCHLPPQPCRAPARAPPKRASRPACAAV